MCPRFWCFHKVSFHAPENLKELPLCPLYRWKNRGSSVVLWEIEEPGCDHRPSGSVPCTLDSVPGGGFGEEFCPGKARSCFLERVTCLLGYDR